MNTKKYEKLITIIIGIALLFYIFRYIYNIYQKYQKYEVNGVLIGDYISAEDAARELIERYGGDYKNMEALVEKLQEIGAAGRLYLDDRSDHLLITDGTGKKFIAQQFYSHDSGQYEWKARYVAGSGYHKIPNKQDTAYDIWRRFIKQFNIALIIYGIYLYFKRHEKEEMFECDKRTVWMPLFGSTAITCITGQYPDSLSASIIAFIIALYFLLATINFQIIVDTENKVIKYRNFLRKIKIFEFEHMNRPVYLDNKLDSETFGTIINILFREIGPEELIISDKNKKIRLNAFTVRNFNGMVQNFKKIGMI